MRFAFISEQSASYKVSTLCRVAQVSRAGYYAWHSRRPSAHQLEDERLKPLVATTR